MTTFLTTYKAKFDVDWENEKKNFSIKQEKEMDLRQNRLNHKFCGMTDF